MNLRSCEYPYNEINNKKQSLDIIIARITYYAWITMESPMEDTPKEDGSLNKG